MVQILSEFRKQLYFLNENNKLDYLEIGVYKQFKEYKDIVFTTKPTHEPIQIRASDSTLILSLLIHNLIIEVTKQHKNYLTQIKGEYYNDSLELISFEIVLTICFNFKIKFDNIKLLWNESVLRTLRNLRLISLADAILFNQITDEKTSIIKNALEQLEDDNISNLLLDEQQANKPVKETETKTKSSLIDQILGSSGNNKQNHIQMFFSAAGYKANKDNAVSCKKQNSFFTRQNTFACFTRQTINSNAVLDSHLINCYQRIPLPKKNNMSISRGIAILFNIKVNICKRNQKTNLSFENLATHLFTKRLRI